MVSATAVGERFLENMKLSELQPDLITMNSVMRAAERAQDWEQALASLQEAEEKQLHPDVARGSRVGAAGWMALEFLWVLLVERLFLAWFSLVCFIRLGVYVASEPVEVSFSGCMRACGSCSAGQLR